MFNLLKNTLTGGGNKRDSRKSSKDSSSSDKDGMISGPVALSEKSVKPNAPEGSNGVHDDHGVPHINGHNHVQHDVTDVSQLQTGVEQMSVHNVDEQTRPKPELTKLVDAPVNVSTNRDRSLTPPPTMLRRRASESDDEQDNQDHVAAHSSPQKTQRAKQASEETNDSQDVGLRRPTDVDDEEAAGEDEEDSEVEDLSPKNPAYVPRNDRYFMHDTRDEMEDDGKSKEPEVLDEREQNRRRKARADVDKWAHDLYDPKQQQPRTKQELVKKYGPAIEKVLHGDEQGDDKAGEVKRKDKPPRQFARQPRRPRNQAKADGEYVNEHAALDAKDHGDNNTAERTKVAQPKPPRMHARENDDGRQQKRDVPQKPTVEKEERVPKQRPHREERGEQQQLQQRPPPTAQHRAPREPPAAQNRHRHAPPQRALSFEEEQHQRRSEPPAAPPRFNRDTANRQNYSQDYPPTRGVYNNANYRRSYRENRYPNAPYGRGGRGSYNNNSNSYNNSTRRDDGDRSNTATYNTRGGYRNTDYAARHQRYDNSNDQHHEQTTFYRTRNYDNEPANYRTNHRDENTLNRDRPRSFHGSANKGAAYGCGYDSSFTDYNSAPRNNRDRNNVANDTGKASERHTHRDEHYGEHVNRNDMPPRNRNVPSAPVDPPNRHQQQEPKSSERTFDNTNQRPVTKRYTAQRKEPEGPIQYNAVPPPRNYKGAPAASSFNDNFPPLPTTVAPVAPPTLPAAAAAAPAIRPVPAPPVDFTRPPPNYNPTGAAARRAPASSTFAGENDAVTFPPGQQAQQARPKQPTDAVYFDPAVQLSRRQEPLPRRPPKRIPIVAPENQF